MLGKGHSGLHLARTMEERKSEWLIGERSQIKSIDLRFEIDKL